MPWQSVWRVTVPMYGEKTYGIQWHTIKLEVKKKFNQNRIQWKQKRNLKSNLLFTPKFLAPTSTSGSTTLEKNWIKFYFHGK